MTLSAHQAIAVRRAFPGAEIKGDRIDIGIWRMQLTAANSRCRRHAGRTIRTSTRATQRWRSGRGFERCSDADGSSTHHRRALSLAPSPRIGGPSSGRATAGQPDAHPRRGLLARPDTDCGSA